MNSRHLISGLWLMLLPCIALAVESEFVEPSFRAQTRLVSINFANSTGETLAFAGRNKVGAPMLGLIRMSKGDQRYREFSLPEGAVAIDKGPTGDQTHALYVLSTEGVLALRAFDAQLEPVVKTDSLYRGRSLAELTSSLDFARNIDGDDVTDFVIPDFDVAHVITGKGRRVLDLPSYRRSYDRNVSYKPATVTGAKELGAGGELYAVRGTSLLSFDSGSGTPVESPLELGLSDEIERETFYNSYEDIDQNEIVLRELDRFADINGDGLPDIVTLETLSEGVFDKSTTYRIHHGRLVAGDLRFVPEADTTLSSRGYQVGARVVPLNDERKIMVTASVRIGVRAIIGALFSRAVTMLVEIHPANNTGTIASIPSTTIKSRVKFDFGTGQVELPTIIFGDINGDGINDLVLKEGNRRLSWRRGTPAGAFESDSVSLDVTGPADGTNVTLADLDGDDKDEMVVLYGRADGEDLAGRLGVYRDLTSAL